MMYRLCGVCARVVSLLLLYVLVSHLAAQEISQDNPYAQIAVGIVNIENVQLNSLAFRSLQEQINTLQSNIQGQIKSRQTTIKLEQEELEAQKLLLSSDALTEKQENIQQKLAGLREFADSANKGLEETYNRAILLIQEKLKESLNEVATERSLNLILNENNLPPTVIFSAASLRIDEIVLTKLNDRIGSIQITTTNETENPDPPSTSVPN